MKKENKTGSTAEPWGTPSSSGIFTTSEFYLLTAAQQTQQSVLPVHCPLLPSEMLMTQALHRSWYLTSTHKVWIQTAVVQIWEVRGCFPDFRDDIILDTQIKNMNNRLRSKVSWLRLSDGFFGSIDFKALWIAIIEICLKTNGSFKDGKDIELGLE